VAEESTTNFAFQSWELLRIDLDTLKHQAELVKEAQA